MKRASWLASSTTKHCAAPVNVHPQNDLRGEQAHACAVRICVCRDFSKMPAARNAVQ